MAAILTEAPPVGSSKGGGGGDGGRRRVVLVECRHTHTESCSSDKKGGRGDRKSVKDDAKSLFDDAKSVRSVKSAKEGVKQEQVSSDVDTAPAKHAAELQAKRLYQALGQTTDNERDAYRRNKTEQTRLEMALDHIGLQRNVAAKDLQRDCNVLRTKSTRISERARIVRESQDGGGNRAVSTSYPRYPYGGHSADPDVLPTIGGGASGVAARMASLISPPPGGGGRRSGARSLTFVSETQLTPRGQNKRNSDSTLSRRPQQSALGPSTSNRAIRSNATRYFDTSSVCVSQSQEVGPSVSSPGWSTAKARLGRPLGDERLHQRTQNANTSGEQMTRARTSIVQLHKQNKAAAAKTGSKQRPLVAIVSSSLIAASRFSKPTTRESASRSLDADIDAVLNSRMDNSDTIRHPTNNRSSTGIGLRQPANFSANYRPNVYIDSDYDKDPELLGVHNEDDEDVFLEPETEMGVDALRSLTSFSHRGAIDRIATPSSNTFRAEDMGGGARRGLHAAFSAKSAPHASVPLHRELFPSRGGRRECRDPSMSRNFMLEKALLREKTSMKGFEEKLDIFFDKLKGTSAKLKKKGSANHWDFRGLDEKLMLY